MQVSQLEVLPGDGAVLQEVSGDGLVISTPGSRLWMMDKGNERGNSGFTML